MLTITAKYDVAIFHEAEQFWSFFPSWRYFDFLRDANEKYALFPFKFTALFMTGLPI